MLLQLHDRTNIQAMEIMRGTTRIGPSPTTLRRHLAGRMKGEAMDMITIHTIAVRTTPPQHSVTHMEAQPMAMTTVHTTLHGMNRMILAHHLVWRMKGEVMAMTMDRIIELLTSLPQHLVLRTNSRPTTMHTICIMVSRTILLRLFPHM